MLAVGVLVALSEAKVDDEDSVLSLFIIADEKVIRLNVSVDNPFLMDLLDALDLHTVNSKEIKFERQNN